MALWVWFRVLDCSVGFAGCGRWLVLWLGLIWCFGVPVLLFRVFYVRLFLFGLLYVAFNSVGVYVFARYLDDFVLLFYCD